ncbi:MAG TPA: glycosyltransferase family 4 protein, partial [Polyangiaceae bacterium]|nr:glycosyltransferase family 4 protein [Polyangiaceae bacterium]
AQGPLSSGLLERVERAAREFDVLVFFTYLYHPTVAGLPLAGRKSLLIPTAHDEPAIHFRIFRRVFESPTAIAFNSVEERDFVLSHFDVRAPYSDIVGCGVELGGSPERLQEERSAPDRPFVLYLGRIAKNKGVPHLVACFRRFKAENEQRYFEGAHGKYLGRELELVIAGSGETGLIQANADVRLAGFVSDAEKSNLLRDTEALMMPSFYESLSLVTLEAFAWGRPVLAQSRCAVTRGHIERSGAGDTYADEAEFSRKLSEMLGNAALRAERGERGRAYVRANYAWEKVESRLLRLLQLTAAAAR